VSVAAAPLWAADDPELVLDDAGFAAGFVAGFDVDVVFGFTPP
jgi:hypothetical protein